MDLGSGLQPVQQGPLSFLVTSPEHRLEIFANRVWLTPEVGGSGGGRVRVDAEIDFAGEGRVEITVVGVGRPDGRPSAPTPWCAPRSAARAT